MADASHLLDPEVEAILQEVAKDPRSILLRVERPELLTEEVASGREIVVRGLTGLTAAEKELLTVHREEAAYLLRLAYYELWDKFVDEREPLFTIPAQRIRRIDRCDITQELSEERVALEEDYEACAAIDHGLSLLASSGSRLIDLAIVSLRIAPSIASRSYIGDEQLLLGQHKSAERVFQDLNRQPLEVARKVSILNTLGVIQVLLGDAGQARETYQEASDTAPMDSGSALNWLSTAVQSGSLDHAREAMRRVDECVDQNSDFLSGWLSAKHQQQVHGIWLLSPNSHQIVSQLSDSADEASGRVLEALRR